MSYEHSKEIRIGNPQLVYAECASRNAPYFWTALPHARSFVSVDMLCFSPTVLIGMLGAASLELGREFIQLE